MDAGDAPVALAGQIPRSCHSLGLSDWTEIPRETLQLKRLLLRPLCGACRLEKEERLGCYGCQVCNSKHFIAAPSNGMA